MSQNANTGEFKIFDASEYRVGIVCAEFNSDITSLVLKDSLAKCEDYGVLKKNIVIHKVHGCVEIPLILHKMAQTGEFDCLVALGVVIRGETAHFDYVCNIVSEGVLRVSLDNYIPVGFGILTCENKEQAEKRINFGGHSVEAALHSSKIIKEYK